MYRRVTRSEPPCRAKHGGRVSSVQDHTPKGYRAGRETPEHQGTALLQGEQWSANAKHSGSMTGRTHKLMGGATTVVACTAVGLPPATTGALTLIAYMSSRLPDLLEKPLKLKHRRETHWPWVGVLVATILGVIAWQITKGPGVGALAGLGVLAGYEMHIVADRLTIVGTERRDGSRVCWLPRGYRFRTVRGGSFGEWVLRFGLVVVAVGVVYVGYVVPLG